MDVLTSEFTCSAAGAVVRVLSCLVLVLALVLALVLVFVLILVLVFVLVFVLVLVLVIVLVLVLVPSLPYFLGSGFRVRFWFRTKG